MGSRTLIAPTAAGGIYNGINPNDGKMCINNSVNHALLAVGYK